jgi:hypothetical protein
MSMSLQPFYLQQSFSISGNNFDKLSLFAKCLNWNFYHRRISQGVSLFMLHRALKISGQK